MIVGLGFCVLMYATIRGLLLMNYDNLKSNLGAVHMVMNGCSKSGIRWGLWMLFNEENMI